MYKAFRRGLFRHVATEEKGLFPIVQRLRGGTPLPAAAKLRLDHGALSALLLPTHTLMIIEVIRTILDALNERAEGPEGVYEQCEQVAGLEIENLIHHLQAFSPVSVSAYSDLPPVFATIRRVLMRAGYHTKPLEHKQVHLSDSFSNE